MSGSGPKKDDDRANERLQFESAAYIYICICTYERRAGRDCNTLCRDCKPRLKSRDPAWILSFISRGGASTKEPLTGARTPRGHHNNAKSTYLVIIFAIAK